MATVPVTKDQLINAATDAETLEQVANGNSSLTVTSRLGQQTKSVAKAIAEISAYADKGAWVTSTAYVIKDLVQSGGITYICTVAHTSGTFATDKTAGKWGIFQTAFPYKRLSEYASLSAAVTATGANSIELVIDKNDSLTGNLTIPSNIALRPILGNQISLGVNKITLNCPILCGRFQFINMGSGSVDGKPTTSEIYPEWFGAIRDGVTDDLAALNAAASLAIFSGSYPLDAGIISGGVGSYAISNTFILPSGVKFKGSGRQQTKIIAKSGFAGTEVVNIGGVAADITANRPAFGCMFEDCEIDADGNATIGVYSINAQEGSGLRGTRVVNWTSKGVYFNSANAPNLWVALCSIVDCEIWGASGSIGVGIHLKSGNNPLLTCHVSRTTVLWLSSTPTAGRTNIWLEKAGIFGGMLNLERSAIGIDMGPDSEGVLEFVSLNTTQSLAPVVKVNGFIGGCHLQQIKSTDPTNGIAVDDGVNTIKTGPTCVNYCIPHWNDLTYEINSPTLSNHKLFNCFATGPDNGNQMQCRDRSLVQWNTNANGHSLRSMYNEFVTPTDNGNDGAVVSGIWDPTTGTGGDNRFRIAVRKPAQSTYDNRFFSMMDETEGTGIDAATWNDNPLRLGAYYLWIDTSGRLRIKGTKPTSDTDGTVVGTQT